MFVSLIERELIADTNKPFVMAEGGFLHVSYTWKRENIAYWKFAEIV